MNTQSDYKDSIRKADAYWTAHFYLVCNIKAYIHNVRSDESVYMCSSDTHATSYIFDVL